MEQKGLASDILELASEQRLEIIQQLAKQKTKLTEMAKILDATKPEIHRNFERLTKSIIIQKDNEGYYSLTSIGKILYSQISLLDFISKNRQILGDHRIDGLPDKFVQRMGALNQSQKIKGMVKILEIWNQIYSNSESYLYNVLNQIPYSPDFVGTLISKIGKGVHVKSIFSHNTVAPKERKKIYQQKLRKFVSEGKIQRKLMQDLPVLLVMNDKEACLMFQDSDGEHDMNIALYSEDSLFHEWCLDYFLYSWNNASEFAESAINDE